MRALSRIRKFSTQKEKPAMKKIRTNWKLAALVLVAVGLTAIGGGNAKPRPEGDGKVCANAILDGAYQWNAAGYVLGQNPVNGNVGDFQPLVEASFAVFDGHGTITNLVSTDNVSGGGSFTLTGTGTYSVNPDCSGDLTFNITGGGSTNLHLVIHRDGENLDYVHTDPGVIIAGTMKKR
jgi:hypothetical protein